jgi:hypothetical protein
MVANVVPPDVTPAQRTPRSERCPQVSEASPKRRNSMVMPAGQYRDVWASRAGVGAGQRRWRSTGSTRGQVQHRVFGDVHDCGAR